MAAEMNVLEMQWREYETTVYPGGLSGVQLTECRRCFYAGARSILTVMDSIADQTPTGIPSEADFQVMDGVAAELKQFAADVNGGRK